MPRRSPQALRIRPPGRQRHGPISTLLIGTCPGPPVCIALHTYLFVDGLDLVTRSDSSGVGMHPARLLRPGGPLHPTDAPRSVDLAAREDSGAGASELRVRVRLRGETVVWSELMYPGLHHTVIEEVRFHLGQYMGEIERAYALRPWGAGPPARSCPGRHRTGAQPGASVPAGRLGVIDQNRFREAGAGTAPPTRR